ncbi:MAG: DUF1116 domain-containing protein [Clostridia bacterium]|nr:DUF1116 domain-containing protein [Clostridia bacterium]
MDIKQRIAEANQRAAACLTENDPYWVDIRPAGECVEGLEDHMILHSGPPVDYEDMVMLHRRGMVSAMLFEGWAKDEKEAVEIIRSGEIKIDSALNHNTVGAGTGIITRSVAMNVIEDRRNHTTAATFPAEGPVYQGGFCGWGLYNEGIAENLRTMREVLFPPMREMLAKSGGIAIKPILAEGMQMGDENHTRQTAADLLFDKLVLPRLFELDLPKDQILRTVRYIVETPRFFHCYGQGASRAAAVAADGIEYSTMVTALAGNGVEFGIKIASLPGQWFTTKAPMMKGRYTSAKFTEKDQLPWIGDSCVVEVAGMGGFAAAASPIVCNLRGMSLRESIDQSREMENICITRNPNYVVPNLDFDRLPVGIDIRLVLKTGVLPAIHGGMFNHEGGLIGAGMARVPMECFQKAMKAFAAKYSEKK